MGVGDRMSIQTTRACITSILDGSIRNAPTHKDPVFQFEFPQLLPGVSEQICSPRDAWTDKAAYDAQRVALAALFKDNFQKYVGPGVTDYSPHGPV